MSEREKKLAMMVGAVAVLVGLMAAYYKLVREPVELLDNQIRGANSQLQDEQERLDEVIDAQDTLARFAALGYGENPSRAAAEAGAMLTRKITEVGLADDRFTRRPISGSALRGAAEIGYSITGRGRLDKIIDLLYLLENAPYLQRLENIVITPDSRNEDEVSVSFRLLTLVVDALPAEDARPLDDVELADDTRRLYDPIAARNMLRPYVPVPPEPDPEPQVADAPEPEPEPAGPGPETFRIVSLSEWQGESEVLVHDTTNDRTLVYTAGDELADGRIVMVDYRPLPMPDESGIRSQSRVIVDVDSEYWAIERGKTLADKRRLSRDELPAELIPDPAELTHQPESP